MYKNLFHTKRMKMYKIIWKPLLCTLWKLWRLICVRVSSENCAEMKMINFAKPSPTISTSKPSNESSETDVDKLTSTIFGCFSINARTIFYRRVYLLQMVCFPFIPILALFVQNFSIFLQQIHTYDETKIVNQQVMV